MYDGKQGLYVLKNHVERFESNEQNPWPFFCLDYALIEELFGTLAAEWAKQRKIKEITQFLSKFEQLQPFKETVTTEEDALSDSELINLDQTIVENKLGYSLSPLGERIVEPALELSPNPTP